MGEKKNYESAALKTVVEKANKHPLITGMIFIAIVLCLMVLGIEISEYQREGKYDQFETPIVSTNSGYSHKMSGVYFCLPKKEIPSTVIIKGRDGTEYKFKLED